MVGILLFLFSIISPVDFRKVSYAAAVRGSVISTVGWTIACSLSVLIPDGIGALIPVAGILATVRDMDNTTSAHATLGALVAMLLELALGDRLAALLYLVAVIVGFASILRL